MAPCSPQGWVFDSLQLTHVGWVAEEVGIVVHGGLEESSGLIELILDDAVATGPRVNEVTLDCCVVKPTGVTSIDDLTFDPMGVTQTCHERIVNRVERQFEIAYLIEANQRILVPLVFL